MTSPTPAPWVVRIALALVLIAAITAVDLLVPHINHTTVALTYLMAVLGIAARWGLWEAILASVASILCAAFFFFPPLMDFAIEDPQNWVAVAAFFIVSTVASQLSTSARRRAREAIARQTELERLYEFSRTLMEMDLAHAPGQAVADQICRVFSVDGAAFRDGASGEVYRAGERGLAIAETALRLESGSGDRVTVLPVATNDTTLGAIGIAGGGLSLTALQSLAHLTAVALERERVQQEASKAEAARESQEFKSLLLDAIAHDFKTPLTSIKFGSSTLQADRGLKASHRELVTVIEEEADRMTSMISDAIHVARLQAGSVQLSRGARRPSELMARAIARLGPQLSEKTVHTSLPEDLPLVSADAALITIAVIHLLDNAVKYSPANAPIAVEAREAEGGVVFTVRDGGPGIAAEERQRIFERFYRGAQRKRADGTGMGLSIVSDIVKVHGGRIWVENGAEGGAVFSFSLPLARTDERQ